MIKKLLLAFMSKYGWMSLVFGTVALFLPMPFNYFGMMAINYALCLLGLSIALIIHEWGHWIFTRLAGEYPKRIVIGTGHMLKRTHFFKSKLNLNSKFEGGYVMLNISDGKYYRLKTFVAVLGGPLVNIAIGIAVITMVPFSTDFSKTITFSLWFGYMQLLIGLANLLPLRRKINGFPMDFDGRIILNILLGKYKKEASSDAIDLSLEGDDYVAEHRYNEALVKFQECLKICSESGPTITCALQFNIGLCYFHLGDYDEALHILKDVENQLAAKELEYLVAYLYNLYANIYLVQGDMEQATAMGQQALQLLPELDPIRHTWGCILVENEEWDRGEEILSPQMDFDYVNSATLLSAMYLALVYQQNGKLNKKDRCWEFVQRNLAELNLVDKVIYERILLKLITK
ncbi:MAG: tetratricopeptide repeat protein [Sphingobacterium sp.]|jgi:Zn-dependent protease|nr:tetratricopeptide repeat protein [Sphingobacterium sp.]